MTCMLGHEMTSVVNNGEYLEKTHADDLIIL